jgi:hypothetical protein
LDKETKNAKEKNKGLKWIFLVTWRPNNWGENDKLFCL